MIMKKIVKPHKARKPSASTDVPSFARGKDQILKSPARLQRHKKNELGEFDTGKDDSIIKNTIAYNQWRQSLPSNLQTETPDYDLYGAFKAGLQPEWNDEDKSYHLGSRDPKTGRILKRPTHPTFGKAIWSDMSLGYYPIYRDGEIYTENPLRYDKGKDDHRYYDYIIAQSMLGNPTAKRMTGEDNRSIPAFGQGDRSNLVLGSFGNYATPSVMNIGGELMYTPNPWEVFPEWMVHNQSFKFNNPNDAIDFAENYKYSSPAFSEFFGVDNSVNYNKGKDSGIHIKKKNRGKFTAAAKRAGMSVQAYARKILNAPKGKYSSTLRKRANFARNFAH